MRIALFGIQGSGKSTQGKLLSNHFHIPYLSTGHIFRELAQYEDHLGRYIKEVISSGLLIPDDLAIDIVTDYLKTPLYRDGYVLDGFPRTLRQAQKFSYPLDKVIYLKIPEKVAIKRLMYRNDDRSDCLIEAINQRITLFHKFSKPVIEFYRSHNKLVEIDGTKSMQEVHNKLKFFLLTN